MARAARANNRRQRRTIRRTVQARLGVPGFPGLAREAALGLPKRLTALAAAVERHEIVFPAEPALLQELRWFEIRRGPAGAVKFGAAPGRKDDLVSAVALALAGAGGVAQQASFAALGLVPFLRSDDHVHFGRDGQPTITRRLDDDGFPEGSWGSWGPWHQ